MEIGNGTYGKIIRGLPGLAPGECVKVFRPGHEVKLMRNRALAAHVNRAAETFQVLEFVVDHFVFGSSVMDFPDGACGLVMALQRDDLFHYVQRHGPVVGPGFVRLHEQLCGAVGWLHRIGVVWGDCSPANVLLGHDGRWRVADGDLWRANTPTAPTYMAYAVAYRSPELLLECVGGSLESSEAWAVGVSLAFANYGRPVVNGDTPRDVLRSILATFASPTVPHYIRHRCHVVLGDADVVFGHVESSPDWAVYCDLLHLDPSLRRRLSAPGEPGDGSVALPGFVSTERDIPPDAREFHTSRLDTVAREHSLSCGLVLAALVIMDVGLSCKSTEHTSVRSEFPSAFVTAALTLAHGAMLLEPDLDSRIPRHLAAAYGTPVHSEALVERCMRWLMQLNNYEHPMGLTLWNDASPGMVEQAIHEPHLYYTTSSPLR
jgi:serine/threonine protein kinase